MRFVSLSGNSINLPLNQFKIDWDGPSASKFQWRGKQFFRKHFSFLEWFEEVSAVGSLSTLRFDFLCRFKDKYGVQKLVFIEMDGKFHYEHNTFFTPTEDDFLSSLERDSCKMLYCQKNKAPLLRIYEDDEPYTLKWFNETFDYPLPLA